MVEKLTPNFRNTGQPKTERPGLLEPIHRVSRPVAGSDGGSVFRRVLVVGNMDFVGAVLVRELNRKGVRDITIADGLERDCWRYLPRLQFTEFLTRTELLARLALTGGWDRDFSHVFFLDGWSDPLKPLALPKALFEMGVNHSGRMIALSPASSIGPSAEWRDHAANRPDFFRPETCEGTMAGVFDRFALARAGTGNFLSLKSYRIFGPNEPTDCALGGLADDIFRQVTTRGEIVLPEVLDPNSPEGQRRYDFLSVTDAVRLTLFLAARESVDGVIEIGSGAGSTAWDLVQAVCFALEQTPSVRISDVAGIPASPDPGLANLSRLREVGWTEELPTLDAAVHHYVETYLRPGRTIGEEDDAEPTAPNWVDDGTYDLPTGGRYHPKRPFVPRKA